MENKFGGALPTSEETQGEKQMDLENLWGTHVFWASNSFAKGFYRKLPESYQAERTGKSHYHLKLSLFPSLRFHG